MVIRVADADLDALSAESTPSRRGVVSPAASCCWPNPSVARATAGSNGPTAGSSGQRPPGHDIDAGSRPPAGRSHDNARDGQRPCDLAPHLGLDRRNRSERPHGQQGQLFTDELDAGPARRRIRQPRRQGPRSGLRRSGPDLRRARQGVDAGQPAAEARPRRRRGARPQGRRGDRHLCQQPSGRARRSRASSRTGSA